MRQPLRKIFICMIVGAFAGASLDLLAHFLGWAELRNFQLVLLEMSYQGLAGLVPARLMRTLSTAWGEMAVLGAVGSVIGLAVGVLLYTLAWRVSRRWSLSAMVLSLSATAGVFTALFGLLWCRIVLFHSDRRMVSPEGLSAIIGSLAFGILAGCVVLWSLRWLSRYRLEKVCLLGGFAVLVTVYLSTSSAGGAMPRAPLSGATGEVNQVVLLGADGATWDIALPMIKEGKLPHLATLMERGSWGDIRTTLPWKSPILWTSIATGKRKEEHGIDDFTVRNPTGERGVEASGKSRVVIPVSLSSRKVKAIWDIVSEAGLRVDVINWYASWPAEPVNGTMLSRRFLRPGVPGRVFPDERTAAIDQEVEALATAGVPRDEAMVAEIGLSLLKKDQPQLHLLYLREIDDMHHFCWGYHAARRGSPIARWFYGQDPVEIEEKSQRIEEAYQRLDRLLGRLPQLVGPETVIIVVSDHGGGLKAPGRMNFTLNPVLEHWGLLRYLPDGRTIDWTTTKVYDGTELPWYEQRALYMNRRPEGPFKQGVSQEPAHHLLDPLIERLTQLKTISGQPALTRVLLRKSSSESLHIVARLNVRLDERETLQGPGLELPLSRMMWRAPHSGTHRGQGMLLMAGPGIKAGYRLRAASILDITPTLLYLLGLPVADDMEGRVLLEAVDPAMRTMRSLRMIATYETGSGRAALPAASSNVDDELLEQLRSLGYIQ